MKKNIDSIDGIPCYIYIVKNTYRHKTFYQILPEYCEFNLEDICEHDHELSELDVDFSEEVKEYNESLEYRKSISE